MPGTTDNLDLRYPEVDDDALPGSQDFKNLADDTDAALMDIKPNQIADVDPGQLLIANASGVVTAVTISGHATISDEGELLIGTGQVGTEELASESVTTGKIDDEAVTRVKTSGFIQTKRQAFVNLPASNISEISITWDATFGNTNYTPVVSLLCAGGNALFGLGILRISEKTATGIKIMVANNGAGPDSGAIQAIAIKD